MHTMQRYLTRNEEAQLFRLLRQRAGSDNSAQRTAARDLYLFKLLRHTGIRVNAAVHITCGDARDALASGYLQRRCDKGGNDGKTHCNSRARRALKGLLLVRRRFGLAETPEAPLLANRIGPGMSVRAVQKRMKYWRDVAGITVPASPHWWRHTKAMRVMHDSTAQDPRGVVMALLDHKSIQSTLIYTRPSREDIERINEEVG